MRIFVMGGGSGRRNSHRRLDHGGRWRTEQEWPLARAESHAVLFASRRATDHSGLPEGRPPSRYLFDPERPVPTIGGNISSGQPIMEGGGFDQRESPGFHGSKPPYLPLASRHDVLVFQTEVLAQDMEVTGPISVHLWVASTQVDTDFTAKLLDIYPPVPRLSEGYALNLTDGMIRAKFRDSWEAPEPLELGEVYPINIHLFPTSNLFVSRTSSPARYFLQQLPKI